MKKLLVILTILSVLVLGACSPNAEPYDDTKVTEDIINLELQYQEMLDYLETLGVIDGLNGQSEIFIKPDYTLNYLSAVTMIDSEKNYMDKSKAPEYLFDENGDFVDANELGALLKMKYYGTTVHEDDWYVVGFQYKMRIRINNDDFTPAQFMARTILMVEELRNYDFYIIGSSEVYLMLSYNGAWVHIKIPVQTMRSDFITITPTVIAKEIRNS